MQAFGRHLFSRVDGSFYGLNEVYWMLQTMVILSDISIADSWFLSMAETKIVRRMGFKMHWLTKAVEFYIISLSVYNFV